MVRFFSEAVAALALVTGSVAASDSGKTLGRRFGGSGGDSFSDMDTALPEQTVTSIIIRHDKRVDGVGLEVMQPSGMVTMYHGGDGGEVRKWPLSPGEIITSMRCHWREKKEDDLIFYVEFFTSLNQKIYGGIPTRNIGNDTAPEGYQLGGFYGGSGDGVDALGAIWTLYNNSTAELSPVAKRQIAI